MSEWFDRSFREDYLIVYKHRNMEKAEQEVKAMIDWLELPKGARVLDLCCGMGRHSLALARFGYDVTGIDLSDVLLAEARKKDEKDEVRWIRGDMRELPFDREFDAVVNLFTSFGYFDREEDNARVIFELARVLKPGGRFVIDFLNPNQVRANLVPESMRTTEGYRIRETRWIEGGFVKKRIGVADPEGAERTYLEQVRLYEREDFERMLGAAGLLIDEVLGDYERRAYGAESPRLILRGRAGA